MPYRLCSPFPSFWREYLKLNLQFKDSTIERKFLESKGAFQMLNFRLLYIMLLILMSANFLSNPFSVNLFQIVYILPFTAGTVFLIISYIAFTRWLKAKTQLAYNCTVLIFVIGSGEIAINILGPTDWNPSLFWVLATHLQTASLLIIIARGSCFQCTILLWIIQTYMWLLLYRVSGTKESFTTSMITYVVYIIALPTMSLSSEFEDRRMFFEVQKREANLRVFQYLIKEVLPSSIILFDKRKILFSNDKFKEIFGVEGENELVTLLTSITVTQDKSTLTKIGKKDFLEEGKRNLYDVIEQWRLRMDTRKISNTFVYFEAKLKSNKTTSRECTFAVQIGYTLWESRASTMVIINDISTIKDYYKELGEHKDHLLATVSHELRTPLNGILGMVEVTLERPIEESVRSNLEVVQRSAKLLLSMVNDILDYSLISNNKLKLNISLINLEKLVAETLKILEIQATMKGIKLEFELKVHNGFVKTDPNRLRQIILNLVGNAIKFTVKGTVTFRIKELENYYQIPVINENFAIDEPSSRDEDENYWDDNISIDEVFEGDVVRVYQMECEDTGIGIARENQRGIFKLYGRLDQVNKNLNQNGVGLGLAISEHLVRALNWKTRIKRGISLISHPGKGSRFFFDLHLIGTCLSDISNEEILQFPHKDPVVSLPISSIFTRNRTFGNLETIPKSLDTKKEINLLAVDDDQINLIVIRNYISSAASANKCYSLTTANNGFEAVEIVKSQSGQGKYFHAILMDCNMPIMDGYEASKILKDLMFKGEIPDSPIIAITANVANSDKEICLQNGMDYYLSKPLKKTDLIAMIEKSLKNKGKAILSLLN